MFEGIYTVYRYTPRLPRRYVPGWTNSFRAFAGWGLWLFVSVFVCLCVPIVTIVLRDRQREDDKRDCVVNDDKHASFAQKAIPVRDFLQ